jgi:hypothetical protein
MLDYLGFSGTTIYGAGTENMSLGYDVAFAAAVPEPETYAQMLVGLGIVGSVVSRRRSTPS